ncbi:MAG: penicillin-binding protein activator LpoB [Thermonemataceae bacterium]
MKIPQSLYFVFIFTSLLFSACTKKQVTRIDPNEQIDLSGRWNDVDSRQVAEKMTEDALEHVWLKNFMFDQDKQPVMIVGMVQNKTHEHIDAQTFIKDIEKEFIQSQKIRIVQNSTLREKLRQERAEQQEFASPDTQKKWGKELGADFMMFGNINSIVDQEGKRKVVYYQVNLELADIETNELVWIGEKKIKKYVKN